MRIQYRQVADAIIFDLDGRIVAGEEAALLRDSIRGVLDRGEKKIMLNLAEVPYIDSAGIGELVRAYVAIDRERGRLKLMNPTRKVREVLEMVKLDTVFQIFSTEVEALVTVTVPQDHCRNLVARAS
jgi:anti-sigma B factor antagonist